MRVARHRALQTTVFFALVGVCGLLQAGRRWAATPGDASKPPVLSPAAAQELEVKLQVLQSANATGPFRPIVITDSEANSYLKYKGQTFLPPSVQNPEVHIASDGIHGVADVDFNQLTKQSPSSQDWTSRFLASALTGRQRVSAVGKLDTGNGQAKVNIQNVSIGGTPVPQVLVDWLLANYVQKQYNLDLSKPIVLPGHVSRIDLGHGEATLVRTISLR